MNCSELLLVCITYLWLLYLVIVLYKCTVCHVLFQLSSCVDILCWSAKPIPHAAYRGACTLLSLATCCLQHFVLFWYSYLAVNRDEVGQSHVHKVSKILEWPSKPTDWCTMISRSCSQPDPQTNLMQRGSRSRNVGSRMQLMTKIAL